MEALTVAQALQQLIQHEGLTAEAVNDNLVRITVPTGAGEVKVGVLLHPEASAAAMYLVHPDQVPEDRRVEAAVLVTQFNYGLMAGALEMDDQDGELRVRTGVDFGAGPATVEALHRALELNLGLMEAARPMLYALCSPVAVS